LIFLLYWSSEEFLVNFMTFRVIKGLLRLIFFLLEYVEEDWVTKGEGERFICSMGIFLDNSRLVELKDKEVQVSRFKLGSKSLYMLIPFISILY